MADPIRAKVDFSPWDRALDLLTGPMKVSLARSMAVAGGKVLRDEAKARAPVGGDMSVTARLPGESATPGRLRSAIYLAYKPAQSTDNLQVYSVSWNHKIAPHGHLLEFGHWQTNVTYQGADGEWYSNPDLKLAQPKWIPAEPFLRPALDAAGQRALQAMLDRGKERWPELLQGVYQPADEDFV